MPVELSAVHKAKVVNETCKAVFGLKLGSLVNLLIFCWAAVIIAGMGGNPRNSIGEIYVETRPYITEAGFVTGKNILNRYLSKWEFRPPAALSEYKLQPAFAAPVTGRITLFAFGFPGKYSGKTSARAPPEPKGAL